MGVRLRKCKKKYLIRIYKIKVTKAHGTHNHFLICHSNDKRVHSKESLLSIIDQDQSDRIDGILILSDKEGLDFKMDYYNNDGTWETMCANGARCAVLYMYGKGYIKNKKMRFEAGDGIHHAEIIKDGYVKLKMITPKYCSDEIALLGISGFHIDSGATHFTVEYPNIKDEEVKRLGSKIRYDIIFSPKGINVNFYEVIDIHNIYVKTYEKGIEDLMMSCGSGAVACAFHLSRIKQVRSPLTVNVPGGKLVINFTNDWDEVWLSGPAKIEFDINIELLNSEV
jgi:diaminopimelate epimerase